MRRFHPAGGPQPVGGFSSAPVTWTLLGVMLVTWLAMEASGGSGDRDVLLRFGAKWGPRIADGEWWRLVAPIFLHIGFFHLLANSFALVIFGGVVERTFGARNYVTVYLVAGVFGNIVSYWAAPSLGAGASGAVSGIVGAYGAFLLTNRSVFGEMGRRSLTTIGVIVAINVVFGLVAQGVDNWAHLGGFASGLALGWWLAPRPRVYLSIGPDGSERRGMTTVLFRVANVRWTLGVAVAVLLALLSVWAIGSRYPYVDYTRPTSLLIETDRAGQAGRYHAIRQHVLQATMAGPTENRAALLYLLRGLTYLDTEQIADGMADIRQAQDYGLPPEYERLAVEILADLGAIY